MARLFAVLCLIGLLAVACSDDAATEEPATADETADDTATAPTFCEATSAMNDGLDEFARTMIATMNGEEPAALILALDQLVSAARAAADAAPADLTDDATAVADAYAGFESLLIEIDYVIDAVPVEDERAAALASNDLSLAIAAVNEPCPAPVDGS